MLLVSSFDPAWNHPRWVKIDLWISSTVAMVVVAIKVMLVLRGQAMPSVSYARLEYVKNILSGIPVGLLSLLVLSGEVRSAMKRYGSKQKDVRPDVS